MSARVISFFVLFSALVALCCGCANFSGGKAFYAGPLASRDNTLQGESRVRMLGPFYEERRGDDGRVFRAFRPLFSTVSEPEKENGFTEVLWPLASFRETRGERFLRILTGYRQYNPYKPDDTADRFVIYPFYFSGRTAKGERYWALFPIAGSIRGILMLDRFDFLLFPLYGKAWKDDIVSSYYVWPFITKADGDDIKRFRIFPFYGVSRNGEDWTKRFIVWPFWSSVEYGGRHPEGRGYILWPFFGHVKLSDQETWMFLPPICRFSHNNRGYVSRLIWPFYWYERNGDSGQTYFWPFWGRRYQKNGSRSFFLWPIGSYEETSERNKNRTWFRILPFFYYEREYAAGGDNTEGEVLSRYTALWPLVSCESREDGGKSLRILNVWPLRRMKQVERNFAPFWTFYRRDELNGSVDHELLWGLFRSRRNAVSHSSHFFPLYAYNRSDEPGRVERGWSLLCGLIGRARHGDAVRWRILWFLSFGDKLKGTGDSE